MIENQEQMIEICTKALELSGASKDCDDNLNWLNPISTLLATIFAGFSASCAWIAYSSSRQSAHREYFDKLLGNNFQDTFRELKSHLRPIKIQAVTTNISDDEIVEIQSHVEAIKDSSIYSVAMTVEESFPKVKGEKLEDIIDSADPDYKAIEKYLEERDKDWQSKVNTCISSIEEKYEKATKRFFYLRKKYKIK